MGRVTDLLHANSILQDALDYQQWHATRGRNLSLTDCLLIMTLLEARRSVGNV